MTEILDDMEGECRDEYIVCFEWNEELLVEGKNLEVYSSEDAMPFVNVLLIQKSRIYQLYLSTPASLSAVQSSFLSNEMWYGI